MDKQQRCLGGSAQFSTPMQQPGNMNQLALSIDANSAIKTVKFPEKFSDRNHPYLITHEPAPRKPRSGIIYTAIKGELPVSRSGLRDCTKKRKASEEEFGDLKDYVMTKEDEEAALALFGLAQTPTDTDHNITSEVEPSSLQPMRSQKRVPVHIYICHFIANITSL